ncbi:[acyl-carrier-protein] S-malonyltransferase, partial [Spiromyces aspiralis]
DTLNKTEHAQPAILTASIAVLRMLEHETGFKANQLCRFTMGHSLGEYTALVAAEALSLADGVRLVWFRGQKMQEAAAGLDPAMTALILRKATVNEIIDEVSKVQRAIDHELGQTDAAVRKEVVQVGNVNTSTQVTLSGTRRAVDKAIAHLHSRDLAIRAVSINVSAPFHSDLMAPAARSLKAEFERVMPFYPPTMTVISNATARPIGCHKDIGDILATQAVTTCRWLESMEYLKDQGTKRWFCVGPGSVIANMVRREYPEMIV